LRIGKTSAVFQEAGKTPLSKEALMIEDRGDTGNNGRYREQGFLG